jgi:hypothetical protein
MRIGEMLEETKADRQGSWEDGVERLTETIVGLGLDLLAPP